jgi:DnaJ family protein C protein 8
MTELIQAFDRLRKAQAQLSDPISRKEIDSMVKHARIRVLKTYVSSDRADGRLIPVGYEKVTDDDERLQNLSPSFDLQIRHKVKEVLVEEELAKKR